LVRAASGAMVGLLSAAAIVLPAVLIYRNLPGIRKGNGPAVAEFANEMAKSIPENPTFVLADDPSRLYLAMGACQRLHLPEQYLFVETPSLAHREYIRWLAGRYPVFSQAVTNWDQVPEWLNDQQEGELVALLVQHYPVYYLHPGFGSHLESVCMTPHRLGGVLHPNPTNLLDTLSLTPGALATNQMYWHALEKESLAGLPELAGTSADARRVAAYYSQVLDYWGTELQKVGTRRKNPVWLEDANTQFIEAIILNPTNFMARANQQCNASLRGGQPFGPPAAASNAVVRWDNHWDQALRVCGPADVPGLDIQIGRYFAQHGSYRQAATLFQRSLELVPGNPRAELDLANSYIDLGLTDAAFALISDAQKHSPENSTELACLKALAYAAKNDFVQADKLLTETRLRSPLDDRFTIEMAEIYRLIGYRVLGEGGGGGPQAKEGRDAAAVWFRKALAAFNEHLQFLGARPIPAQDTNLASLRVAEMQKMITNN
jgi:tetratricopeptide (TPR) repeat protein